MIQVGFTSGSCDRPATKFAGTVQFNFELFLKKAGGV